METKLWFALCALLLLNLASADHDLLSNSSGNSSHTATEDETMASIPMRTNGSVMSQNESHTDPQPSQPDLTEIHPPTSDTPLSPTGANHINHTEISTSPSTNHNTSDASAPPLPSSTTLSNQPTQDKTNTSTPTAEPPATTTTSTTTTTTTPLTTITSTLTSSTSSSSPTSAPLTASSQFDEHPRTSSESPPKVTTTLLSSTSTQAKIHVDNPSQLNVEGDTKMVHKSPTLDPLLAGLVSAFIITAVIITLLLFLKLRRRDNRPEFRRLQDLPMDDIMEDTPLSMYSY